MPKFSLFGMILVRSMASNNHSHIHCPSHGKVVGAIVSVTMVAIAMGLDQIRLRSSSLVKQYPAFSLMVEG